MFILQKDQETCPSNGREQGRPGETPWPPGLRAKGQSSEVKPRVGMGHQLFEGNHAHKEALLLRRCSDKVVDKK